MQLKYKSIQNKNENSNIWFSRRWIKLLPRLVLNWINRKNIQCHKHPSTKF